MINTPDLITFNQLFNEYKGRFIRFSQTYVRDIAVAEDIVIDSLVYYWENRQRLDENTNIPAYVLTVIKHKCLNYLQQQQLHKDIEQSIQSHAEWELSTRIATLEACNPDELFNAEAMEIVNRTLARLPSRTREIFIMSRMQNMSHKEIAAKLDITTKGVEFHIGKALKELRISLKDYLPVFLYLFFY
ncbi:RNA polymerase sigma-70 factor [Bacteroides sp.]